MIHNSAKSRSRRATVRLRMFRLQVFRWRMWIVLGVAGVIALTGCSRNGTDEASGPGSEGPETERNAGAASDVQVVTVNGDFMAKLVLGEAGGPVRAESLASACSGHIANEPNFILDVQEPAELRLAAAPAESRMSDLTLVVASDAGRYYCADDNAALNPVVDAAFEPGRYRVWVGAYSNSQGEPFELQVSRAGGGELPGVPDGPPPAPTSEGEYGGLRVANGTGPGVLRGVAGGTRRSSELRARCDAFVSMWPDHVVTNELAQELVFRVESDQDTVLVLEGPNEVVHCNDDSIGLNPLVRETFAAGTWNVYVGTWEPSVFPEYTLHISR